jgi:hypothetical protein
LPDHLEGRLADAGMLEQLPRFPLGSDFTEIESGLAVALEALGQRRHSAAAMIADLWRGRRLGHDARLRASLERMGLARPRGLRDRAYRAVLAAALEREILENPRPVLARRRGRRPVAK